MEIDKLVSDYVSAAIAHGDAIEQRDYETANGQHDLLYEAYFALEKAGRINVTLSEFMTHQNPHVRGWIATHMLKFDAPETTRVLRKLSAEGGNVGFSARIVLRE